MKILNVVGARPNFIKVAPVHEALRSRGHTVHLVHTGQHYDHAMSQVFFNDLGMPEPDSNLGVGGGSHVRQTARVMAEFEPVLEAIDPDWVVVAGDVNSSLACGLCAAQRGVRLAHLEAGLRCFDRSMPEERNRVLIDHLSDLLLTPSEDADANLRREGIDAGRICRVGNAMIDSLRRHEPQARQRAPALLRAMNLTPGGFALVTLHRSSNVDDTAVLAKLCQALHHLSEALPVVFPVHPRTRPSLNLAAPTERFRLIDPLGYLDFLALQTQARLMLTDSGGIQEETTALGVPCLTLRDNTERPITVDVGTNTVVGMRPEAIVTAAHRILSGKGRRGAIPPLWDGHTAPRVVAAIEGWKAP